MATILDQVVPTIILVEITMEIIWMEFLIKFPSGQ